jgi:hypothetical protein
VLDRYTGVLTPLTVWPAGTYLVDYRPLVVSPSTAKNPAVGDTDFLLGGLNPIAGHSQIEYDPRGVLAVDGDYITFTTVEPVFLSGLHEGAYISVREPIAIAPFKVVAILATNKAVVSDPQVTAATGLMWSFLSREPSDGVLTVQADGCHLRTPSGMFRHFHKEDHVRITDATAGGGINNGYWRVLDVFSAWEVLLAGTHVPETGVHWRLMGGGGCLGIVEQPLQIRVY